MTLLLFACATTDATAEAVVAWDPDVASDDGPPVDAAAAQAALQAILDEVVGLNASPTLALFDDRLALRDEACPYRETTESAEYGQESIFWFAEACVASSGALFDGYTFARETTRHRTEDGTEWSGADIKGRIAVIDADGATFGFGGDAFSLTGTNAGQTLQQSGMRGAITWTGGGWDDASFTRGRLAELNITATWAGAPMLGVQGDVSGFEGVIPAVVFDPIVAIDARLGAACPQELGGSIRARDAAGRWYEAAFDGALTPTDTVDGCDGCGAWSLDGEVLGEVCLDPSALLGWQERAW